MKKTVCAILAACLLTLCCVPVLSENVRIVLWHSMSEDAGVLMDKYVQQFNDTLGREAGITVEAVFQGKYSDAVSKMNSILSAGQADALPDVMQLDATGKVSFASAGSAYTADRAVAEHPGDSLEEYLAPALANWQLAGVQLGLPFATSTTVTYYNKTALDAAGFAAPDTLADIGKMASLAGDGIRVYACVPNTPTLANWLGQMGSDLVNCRNGSEGTASALDCVENGALSRFLTVWKDLYATGALDNTSASTDEFAAGRLLVMTSSSSSISLLMDSIGGAFEMGVCSYPRVDEEASYGATVSGSCLVMFDHGEARRQAAWELVKYLTGPEVQSDLACNTGYLPAHARAAESEGWLELTREYPQHAVGLEQLARTPAFMRSVTVGPSANFYYAVMDGVSAMLEDDLTVDETVSLLADDLNGQLAKYISDNQ